MFKHNKRALNTQSYFPKKKKKEFLKSFLKKKKKKMITTENMCRGYKEAIPR